MLRKSKILVFAVFQFFLMWFLPETPHYLVLRKNEAAAVKVLRRIHKTSSVKQELANIRHSCQQSQAASCSQLFSTQVIASSLTHSLTHSLYFHTLTFSLSYSSNYFFTHSNDFKVVFKIDKL